MKKKSLEKTDKTNPKHLQDTTKLSLDELTGRRYKITLDEAWHHERSEVRNPDSHWYEQIPCSGFWHNAESGGGDGKSH